MQGTILVIDGVSTNRIMLKVQLAAAYYDAVQAGSVAEVLQAARNCRPDLVLTAMSLPDGTAADVKRTLAADEALADLPVIAVSDWEGHQARLQALAAGIDDVLQQPVDDVILQARIRSLLRARSASEELNLQREASQGFILPLCDRAGAESLRNATVALVAEDPRTAMAWRDRLSPTLPYALRTHAISDIHGLMQAPVADAIIIELNEASAGPGLRLLADLRARAATRKSVVIAVPNPADPHIAAEALDRGAHDVLQTGFDVDELALRLNTQLQQKARNDLMRDSVRNGLRAANLDPMTGLYNRRYAKPFLDRVAHSASETGGKFAVMLADLDHFKRINDVYGHPAGDAVLIEAARRMQAVLGPADLLARVGGEEFMAVLPGATEADASLAAIALCNAINSTPFQVPGAAEPVKVTISVGAVMGGAGHGGSTAALVEKADQALYDAKNAGRNQVTLSPECTEAA
ncbi:diguanylate cyclase domain-containing protein [Leisingera sp. ANG-M7]|uniref:diguanylate cyclase domain-containing protein n=1 Tax=Leisingera sp. ANG-M7 TaxID=1577902 RepID=UPI00057F504E|nr:diguanylate cyclase [Leisingera sp. ANG-M7]KIC39777.1 diguanylate cyclase [Leisingera sp. ANG-M7]